jgi:hypothetical protein
MKPIKLKDMLPESKLDEKKMLPVGSSEDAGITMDPPEDKSDDGEEVEKPQPKKETDDKTPAPEHNKGITMKPGGKEAAGSVEKAGGEMKHQKLPAEHPIEKKIRQIRLIRLLRKIRDAVAPTENI